MEKVIRDRIEELRGQACFMNISNVPEFGTKRNTVGPLPMSSIHKGYGQAVSRRQLGERV